MWDTAAAWTLARPVALVLAAASVAVLLHALVRMAGPARRAALVGLASLAALVAVIASGAAQASPVAHAEVPAAMLQDAWFPVGALALVVVALLGRGGSSWLQPVAHGLGLLAVFIVFKLAFPREGSPDSLLGAAAGFPADAVLVLQAGWMLRDRLGRLGRQVAAFGWAAAASVGLVAGTHGAWDLVAGILLLASWNAAVIAGFAIAPTLPAWMRDAPGRVADRILARPMTWLFLLITLGVGLRAAALLWTPLGNDAYPYAVMGRSLLETGAFTMPWGDLHSWSGEAVASHHYPPLYPAFLAPFLDVVGFAPGALRLASFATSIAAILAAYACTRDLYGRNAGWVAAAAIAVNPLAVQATGQAYSENLVLLLFTLTLWAILKSLTQPRMIVLAGLLAGFGYLTKSSVGAFFVIAGLGGLGWRLYWKGWKVLRDPSYVLAIAIFGTLVVAWAARNVVLFGDWQTSAHLASAYADALAHPWAWFLRACASFAFYGAVVYLLYHALLPMLGDLHKIPKLRDEHDSGLWLALGLPLVLTSAVDGALWLHEGGFALNNARYVGFVAVPAAWLLVRHLDLRVAASRIAVVAAFALLIAGSVFFAKPYAGQDAAFEEAASHITPGASLGFVDLDNHAAYRLAFAVDPWEHTAQFTCLRDTRCPVGTPGPDALTADWVLAAGDVELAPRYDRVPLDAGRGGAHPASDLSLWRRA